MSSQSEQETTKRKKGNLVAANLFKKKMAKDIKDLMEDKTAAKQFLEKVVTIKTNRKKRNI